MDILFLYFVPPVESFLSLLLSIILRSCVSMCPLSLSFTQESAQWHNKVESSLIHVPIETFVKIENFGLHGFVNV